MDVPQKFLEFITATYNSLLPEVNIFKNKLKALYKKQKDASTEKLPSYIMKYSQE